MKTAENKNKYIWNKFFNSHKKRHFIENAKAITSGRIYAEKNAVKLKNFNLIKALISIRTFLCSFPIILFKVCTKIILRWWRLLFSGVGGWLVIALDASILFLLSGIIIGLLRDVGIIDLYSYDINPLTLVPAIFEFVFTLPFKFIDFIEWIIGLF